MINSAGGSLLKASTLQQQMYFFCTVEKFMLLFYNAIFESITRYWTTAWYANLSVRFKAQIARLLEAAMTNWVLKATISSNNSNHFIIRQTQEIVSGSFLYVVAISKCLLTFAMKQHIIGL